LPAAAMYAAHGAHSLQISLTMTQAVARHPVAVGMCVGPYIKNWRACVSFHHPASCAAVLALLEHSRQPGVLELQGRQHFSTSEGCCHICIHPRTPDAVDIAATRAASLMAARARRPSTMPWCVHSPRSKNWQLLKLRYGLARLPASSLHTQGHTHGTATGSGRLWH
jgi:hypothetical protein